MKFKKLFEPIKIGPVEIKNRIAFSPMNVHFSHHGYITEQDIAYYAARAKGGVGLIIFGVVLVSKRAADQTQFVVHHLYDVTHMNGMGDLAETIHHFGAKTFIQLTPGTGKQQRYYRTQPWAPSAIPYPENPKAAAENLPKVMKPYLPLFEKKEPIIPREMTIEEIQQDHEDFLKSADLAILAGFDGIQIHAPHGYLIHEFFSPRSNKRNDKYGGSLENRARYLIELIEKFKKKFGSAVPLDVRISGAEHVEGGFTAEEAREIAKMAAKAGVDSIYLSDGCVEAYKYMFPEQDNSHLLEEQGRKLRDAVKVPVTHFSINDPTLCERAIAEGQTDMVGLGRQLLADPDWPNKVKEGRVDEIVKCKRCCRCSVAVRLEGGIRCSVNPNVGRERYMPEYWPNKRTAKIPETLRRLKLGGKEPEEN